MGLVATQDRASSDDGDDRSLIFLITGAAGGLGRAMVAGLIDHGFRGIAVDRNREALASVAEEVGQPDRLMAMVADLADQDSIDRVLWGARKAFGRVDILINNAGIGPNLIRPNYFADPVNVDEISPRVMRQFFEINAIAPMLLAIGLIPNMRKNGWGRIINVTTSLPSMLRRGLVPYGGTKASLEAHSAIIAQDLEGTGITVNVLIPGGPADTGMIPVELGLERAALIKPGQMVPPLLWLIGDAAATGKRVIAGRWDNEAGKTVDHPAIRPIAWPLGGDVTIMPAQQID